MPCDGCATECWSYPDCWDYTTAEELAVAESTQRDRHRRILPVRSSISTHEHEESDPMRSLDYLRSEAASIQDRVETAEAERTAALAHRRSVWFELRLHGMSVNDIAALSGVVQSKVSKFTADDVRDFKAWCEAIHISTPDAEEATT